MEKLCEETGDLYINANDKLSGTLDLLPHDRYILDATYSNARWGVKFYTESVLESCD